MTSDQQLTAGVYIQDLFESNNWPAIAAAAEQSFGIKVDYDALHEACLPFCSIAQRNPINVIGHDSWSDSTWLLFLKTRLCEMGLFPHSGADDNSRTVTARFHFFFIHLEETEEMLIRLRRSRVTDGSEPDETLARSKIRSYMLKRGL